MLSILIPTYNYSVVALVQELYRQAQDAGIVFEIIVIDDHSEPQYREGNRTISTLSHCKYLEKEINLGRTLSRKSLAELAAYDTLLFVDADIIPVSDSFIKRYLPFINSSEVAFGGVAYKTTEYDRNVSLRAKYGRCREEKSAVQRQMYPYGSILSGNMLIPKKIFLENNYKESSKFYGMDIFFAYSLFRNKVNIQHIDNPVFHLGLEDNTVFFEKCLASVRSRKKLLSEAEGIEEINSLLKHYKKLKRFGIAPLAGLLFNMTEPLLKKMILKKDPSLFCLDIYRLGYICSIK